ncbi:hypothetical protein STEG23_024069 [Scotinomys teguina]
MAKDAAPSKPTVDDDSSVADFLNSDEEEDRVSLQSLKNLESYCIVMAGSELTVNHTGLRLHATLLSVPPDAGEMAQQL